MVMAALSRMFQVKIMEKKDSRIKIVNEVLNGIKVWEADRGRETESYHTGIHTGFSHRGWKHEHLPVVPSQMLMFVCC